ncbi:hypothetical protein K488DRAFT_39337, partial [Vararia minispora EC-137]
VLDSRAAVYEKLERPKDALKDAKKVIDLAPQHWHGYYRSAKLFYLLRKYPAALVMARMALERLQTGSQNHAR